MVRGFFLGGAFFIVVSPVFGEILPGGTSVHLISVVALLVLAALTTPVNTLVMTLNCAASAVSFGLVETLALENYAPDSLSLFAVRQTAAVIFLAAFYFAIKTLRAMRLHQLGHRPYLHEFDNT